MKTNFKTILLISSLIVTVFLNNSFGGNTITDQQSQDTCAIKLGGGVYIIDCEKPLLYHNYPIFTVPKSNNDPYREPRNLIGISFDVYNANGKIIAKVTEGRLTYGDKNRFIIESTSDEFLLKEKNTNWLICRILTPGPPHKLNYDCELWLWMNLYMPNGFLFKATPEQMNVSIRYVDLRKGGMLSIRNNSSIEVY